MSKINPPKRGDLAGQSRLTNLNQASVAYVKESPELRISAKHEYTLDTVRCSDPHKPYLAEGDQFVKITFRFKGIAESRNGKAINTPSGKAIAYTPAFTAFYSPTRDILRIGKFQADNPAKNKRVGVIHAYTTADDEKLDLIYALTSAERKNHAKLAYKTESAKLRDKAAKKAKQETAIPVPITDGQEKPATSATRTSSKGKKPATSAKTGTRRGKTGKGTEKPGNTPESPENTPATDNTVK